MSFEPPAKLKEALLNAPKKPGVYIFLSETGERIYVGKAVNLSNRSRSYFANYKRLDPRIQNMVELARDIQYHEVENEVEALLLETNLIKKYQPRFNVLMTDDKSYIWVKVYSNMDFPIVRIVREKKEDNADYFGPYPAVSPIKRMLKDLRRIFPYRTCNRVIEMQVTAQGESVYSSDLKPCLYYHIGLCAAPCMTTQSKQEYREIVNGLKRFLRSEHEELKKDLQRQMQQLSTEKNYEQAAQVRDKLKDLNYLTQYSLVDESVDENVLALRKAQRAESGLKELTEKLGFWQGREDSLDLGNFRIECYDISNIQGTNAVAAMVVGKGGKLLKSDYRKFKIKSKTTPDDFAMLQETLKRRLKYLVPELVQDKPKLDKSFTEMPQLLVIDGGKGQLSSVLEILNEYQEMYGLQIPAVGLAKREEEVFIPDYKDGKLEFKLLKLSRRSPALKLIQQLRDEAHRFGLGYHRLLRSKGMTYSQLDLIPGIGEVTKKRLLLAFGSVAGIKKAKLADIEAVVKNRSTAAKLKKLL
jgi:excinuclease ABC subunit C